MADVKIRWFDPDKLDELAHLQTEIYNLSMKDSPEFLEAKVEDTIKRFKRESFDQSRMFYAYDGDKMVGYSGLTGKNQKENLRGVGYPHLRPGIDQSVRDLLYNQMEQKCHQEGTKYLRHFTSEDYPQHQTFFKDNGFSIKIEYLVHEKELHKNEFKLPEGYSFRELRKEDLPILEELSYKDPKMKSPFVASDYEAYLTSTDYDPSNVIVAQKDNEIIGFYGSFIPADSKIDKAYFAGVVIHKDHQHIESYLAMEIENRVIAKNKKIFETTYFPDSPRLPDAKKRGFIQTKHAYLLEKEL